MPRPALPASTLASIVLHGALLALLWRAPAPRRFDTVKIDVVESTPKPKPPPLVAPPKPRPEEPKLAKALPPDAPEAKPREPETPPPPNEPPPGPPSKAPVKVGISMSSTTASGGFAAPVGNTLYGQLPKVAPAPEEAKPYAAKNYVPPTQVTVMPRLVSSELPKSAYPPEAYALGLEARVYVMALVDETGKVVDARAVDDPGHGFAEAAVRGVLRYFKFEPPRRGDEPVSTWLRVTVSFEMD